MNDLLDTTQAGKVLGVCASTVRKLVERGQLTPARRIGRSHLFRPRDVAALRGRPSPGRPAKKKSNLTKK